MSIGSNDVGFGALAAYAMTESAADFAPIAAVVGRSIRFSPQVSRVYMNVLDQRMKALKDAFQDGFGVAPARVFQSSYEPIQYDENGALCGAQPTLGMDVHPGLQLSKPRLQETADFLRDFLGRLECIAGSKKAAVRPISRPRRHRFHAGDRPHPRVHQAGPVRARPKRALADGISMKVPRKPLNGDAFKPYSPAATLPYAHHWRLFRTPNDAFLAANTHREGTPLFDILQPAYAGEGSTAARFTRPPRRMPSWPITWCATCARSWIRPKRSPSRSRACSKPRAVKSYSRINLDWIAQIESSDVPVADRSTMHSYSPLISTPAALARPCPACRIAGGRALLRCPRCEHNSHSLAGLGRARLPDEAIAAQRMER